MTDHPTTRRPLYRCRHEAWTENPSAVISIDETGRALYNRDALKVCLSCGCLDVDADLVARYIEEHPDEAPAAVDDLELEEEPASPAPAPAPKADPVTLHAPAARPVPGLIESEHPWRVYAGLAAVLLAASVTVVSIIRM